MAETHDRTSRPVAPSSSLWPLDAIAGNDGANRVPILCQAEGSDPLSDVLRAVRLSGALFFLVDASYPWGVDVPHANSYASIIMPRGRHVVSYHIILEGKGWAEIPGGESEWFEAGDILVFPHGDAYAMRSAPAQTPEFDVDATVGFFRDMAAGKLPFVFREGGGGIPRSRFVCGFLGCDMHPFNPVLSTLPRMLRIPRIQSEQDDLLGRLIEMTLHEARMPRVGGDAIRLRLSELIFVEVVRRYLDSLPADGTGWLAGIRDPAIGRALAALHPQPSLSWTLETLAREAGLSRAAFAARFAHLVGMPPIEYLTRWRMQVAARMLSDSTEKVAAVGRDVGYASEAAFSRAFKKVAGVSPAAWRNSRGTPIGR